jgi:hypothetical protein
LNTKLRYEPPLLVDMTEPDLCGEFSTCITGSNRPIGGGSCLELVRCNTGTGAERCDSGNYACGCDSCCQTGKSYTTTGGFPWVGGCQCMIGSQAALNCNWGTTTGGVCVSTGDWAGGSTCASGGTVFSDTQNCGSGY